MGNFKPGPRKLSPADAILEAAPSHGEDGKGELVGYLKFLAIHHPRIFVKLLAKTLPRPSPKRKRSGEFCEGQCLERGSSDLQVRSNSRWAGLLKEGIPPRKFTGKKLSDLTMASDRKIAANRRNACRSTGPRSRGGKQRAGRNSFRHGLSISSSASCAAEAEPLARQIAGDTNNAIILERARAVAYAELDLARVQRAKIALIERNRAIPRNI